MALEMPYANISESVVNINTLGAVALYRDATIEIAISIINNSSDILPDHLVEIVRINNLDPTSMDIKNLGYGMYQAYKFAASLNDSERKFYIGKNFNDLHFLYSCCSSNRWPARGRG
jgi:hypothetical protein